MDMFSKKLYELDKIAEKYMISEQQEVIDEQQETIAEQRQKINEMQEERKKKMEEAQKQGIRITVKILQDEEVPEQKIRQRICERYQISEEQAQEFFDQERNG